MKAKLTGEVRVNFKCDYLPLEKMATPADDRGHPGQLSSPEKHVDGR